MNKQVIDEFEKEYIVLHTATIFRLFELSKDAALLYIFLIKNAKIQDTNSVWCTNTFIKNGLNWGSAKLTATKALLVDNEFIFVKEERNNGRFGKRFIRINYMGNPRYSGAEKLEPQDARYTPEPSAVETDSVLQDTNASNKKLNASNKKESLSTSVDKVASDTPESFLLPDTMEKYGEALELNAYWKKIIGKGGHNSLESKFLISGKDGRGARKSLPVSAPITSAIRMTGMKPMKMAIRNYKTYQDSGDQWTPGVNLSLGEFCHGMQYEQYIDSVPPNPIKSTNPWDIIRKLFSPLTSAYDSIFDAKKQRYYGFQTEKIESEIRWRDTAEMMKGSNEKWDFNAFMELEWMIAGMLWKRKQRGDKQLEICQKYIDKWNELIPQFKKQARKWLKQDFEFFG